LEPVIAFVAPNGCAPSGHGRLFREQLRSGETGAAVRSIFNDEKKLSIAALSHTLPERLIEHTTPWSAIDRRNWLTGIMAGTLRMMQQRIRFAIAITKTW
jgi:hypothetical protein